MGDGVAERLQFLIGGVQAGFPLAQRLFGPLSIVDIQPVTQKFDRLARAVVRDPHKTMDPVVGAVSKLEAVFDFDLVGPFRERPTVHVPAPGPCRRDECAPIQKSGWRRISATV